MSESLSSTMITGPSELIARGLVISSDPVISASSQRELDVHVTRAGLGPDASRVPLDDALADGQAEPRAIRTQLQPRERSEDALQVLRPDLRPRVAHAQHMTLRPLLRREGERESAEARMRERIVDQIAVQELHQVLVDVQPWKRPDLDANAPRLDLRGALVEHGPNDYREISVLAKQYALPD